jgi:hypothetical protein
MAKALAIYQLDVDVAVRRPPTPANTVTINSIVGVKARRTISRMDNDARNAAAQMGLAWGPMVLDARIVRAEL